MTRPIRSPMSGFVFCGSALRAAAMCFVEFGKIWLDAVSHQVDALSAGLQIRQAFIPASLVQSRARSRGRNVLDVAVRAGAKRVLFAGTGPLEFRVPVPETCMGAFDSLSTAGYHRKTLSTAWRSGCVRQQYSFVPEANYYIHALNGVTHRS